MVASQVRPESLGGLLNVGTWLHTGRAQERVMVKVAPFSLLLDYTFDFLQRIYICNHVFIFYSN